MRSDEIDYGGLSESATRQERLPRSIKSGLVSDRPCALTCSIKNARGFAEIEQETEADANCQALKSIDDWLSTFDKHPARLPQTLAALERCFGISRELRTWRALVRILHAVACAVRGSSCLPVDWIAVLAPLPVSSSHTASSNSGSRKIFGRRSAICCRSLHKLRSGSYKIIMMKTSMKKEWITNKRIFPTFGEKSKNKKQKRESNVFACKEFLHRFYYLYI